MCVLTKKITCSALYSHSAMLNNRYQRANGKLKTLILSSDLRFVVLRSLENKKANSKGRIAFHISKVKT